MKVRTRFVDLLVALVRWKKFIVLNFMIVCLLTAMISMVIPKWFQSRAIILPPADEGGLNFSALLSDLPLSGLGFGGGLDQGTSLVVAIANSRALRTKLIEHFNLIRRFNVENIEEALEVLRGHIKTEITDEGMISLSVSANTPYFADKEQDDEARKTSQQMAEFMVEQIDLTNRLLKNEQAGRSRIFIEKRYMECVQDLKNAEDSLRVFQNRYGVLILPEQLQASITAMTDLRAKILMLETEILDKENYLDRAHPELLQLKNRLKAIKSEYQNMLKGEKQSDNVIIPLAKAPDLGVTYVRLYREVMLQEKIMEFLLPQYEQARIQEAKDTPTLQLLDPPHYPIKRAKPKRAMLVLFAGFSALLLSVFAANLNISFSNFKNSGSSDYEQIRQLLAESTPRFFRNR